MTTVSSVGQSQSATSAASASSSVGDVSSASDQQDRFLKLLVAQLNNQDPLNPMDNSQITSQMAQISTVSGIEKLNTTLQGLTSSQSAAEQVQAASLVGHQVLMTGADIRLSQGFAAGGFSLDQAVDQLTVTVKDASGAIMHKVNLGAQDAGMHTFQWDGKTDSGQAAADGAYTFTVDALAAGKTTAAQTLTLGQVYGVRTGTSTSGTTLDLGAAGTAQLSDVKQIY